MSWKSSDSLKSISPAIVAALGEMTDVPKNHEAKVAMKTGGSYGYKYADLADTVAMVRPILAKHGLAVSQTAFTPDPTSVTVATTIWHTSGEWVAFEPLAMPVGRTAQETGSAITYGRRYALLAALGLAADDDDAASVSPRQTKTSAEKRPAATVTPNATITPVRPVASTPAFASNRQISTIKAIAKGKELDDVETLELIHATLGVNDVVLETLSDDQAEQILKAWKS